MSVRENIGYCHGCLKNTPQVRQLSTPAFRVLDAVTLHIGRLFGVGPWYCVHCENRSLVFHRQRRDAAHVKLNEEGEQVAERVGNFIRNDESLVMRRQRASRFSEKYRDGVVNKVISGKSTISQIGRELNISERDIVDWIADNLCRKQERIDELKRLLSVLQRDSQQPRLGFEPVTFGDDAEIIDGKVHQS